MKTQIIFLTTIILLLSVISAVEVYAGESYSFVIQEPYEYYSVVGNSTPIDIAVVLDGLNVTVTFGNYINDDFELVFFNSEKEVITVYQSSGGGGGSSHTKYVDKIVTEYETVTEYKDKIVEKEVPGEIIIRNNIPWWVIILISILIIGIIYLFLRNKEEVFIPSNSEKVIRRYENEDKQKDSYANNAGSWN